jgi:L-fuculose-phosphate aldolase
MLARGLGRVHYLSEDKSRELLELKGRFGFHDPRMDPEMKDCDICANDLFRGSWQDAGVERRAFDAPPPMGKTVQPAANNGTTATDQEQLIQTITDRVLAALTAASKA